MLIYEGLDKNNKRFIGVWAFEEKEAINRITITLEYFGDWAGMTLENWLKDPKVRIKE